MGFDLAAICEEVAELRVDDPAQSSSLSSQMIVASVAAANANAQIEDRRRGRKKGCHHLFRRNQSSSNLNPPPPPSSSSSVSRIFCRRPSLPAIPPPIIEEMSSSVGHARTRRSSIHPDWMTMGQTGHPIHFENRIHHNDNEPPLNYILANFKDIDNTLETIQLEPRQRLYEAFEPHLRARGLTINDIHLFIDKSSTPVPEISEAQWLAGQQIFVRARGASMIKVGRHTRAAHSMDESNERSTRKMSAEAVSRKSSFVNSRILNRSRNHPNLNGSDDAECRSNDSSLSVRDISQFDEPSCSEIIDDGGTRRARSVTSSRISLFFGKEKNDMINRLNSLKEEREIEYPQYQLEKDWRQIVKDYQNLSEKAIKQQEAIWEIITTEHRYIKLLHYLDDLSFYLQHLQSAGYLKDIDKHLVFINFPSLLRANLELWNTSIEPILSDSRATGDPLDVRQLWTGFEKIGEWSQFYIVFNVRHGESHMYLQKKTKEHEQFREFVQWAESQENLDRQKLCDTLSQPMQRFTRYNLLLKALLKVTTHDDERKMLEKMIENTESATKQLNYEMNNNDLRLQLADITRSIDAYECVDAEEIEKLFGSRIMLPLDHCMPLLPHKTYRTTFHKGDVRMAESRKGSKVDVHCMVFTDMFLICRKIQGKKDRLKIIKPPIHIARMVFHPFPEANGFYVVSMTEFRTPAALYMMYTSGIEETHRWTEMLKMAEEEYKRIYSGSWFDVDMAASAAATLPPGLVAAASHRKCSSMDSQAVAAHAHLNYMHRGSVVSSAEHLDRHHHHGSVSDIASKIAATPPRHKLSVASCVAMPLSSSKSSVDLYVSLGDERGDDVVATDVADDRSPRSRSNSSANIVEGKRSRSASPSCDESHVARDSPTLLVTPEHNNNNDASSATASHSGRRFEKRYHTADAIDVARPKASMLSGAILKRFSWNVSSAVGGSSRKRLESSRRSSQAASVDSFGSSTSGISTASSASNANEVVASASSTTTLGSHISTIAITDSPTSEPQATLTINLESVENSETPPPPEIPPPSTTPSPNSTSSSSKNHPKHQELLKFIMDNHLETSDV